MLLTAPLSFVCFAEILLHEVTVAVELIDKSERHVESEKAADLFEPFIISRLVALPNRSVIGRCLKALIAWLH